MNTDQTDQPENRSQPLAESYAAIRTLEPTTQLRMTEPEWKAPRQSPVQASSDCAPASNTFQNAFFVVTLALSAVIGWLIAVHVFGF